MKETNVYTKIVTDENLMETQSHGSLGLSLSLLL